MPAVSATLVLTCLTLFIMPKVRHVSTNVADTAGMEAAFKFSGVGAGVVGAGAGVVGAGVVAFKFSGVGAGVVGAGVAGAGVVGAGVVGAGVGDGGDVGCAGVGRTCT